MVLGVQNLPRRYGPAEAAPHPHPAPAWPSEQHLRTSLDDESLRIRAHSGEREWHRRPLAQRGGWGWRGGDFPGPVSSGELLNAQNQNLVAGQEWPRRSRLSVVPGRHLPSSPARASHASRNPTTSNGSGDAVGATRRVGLGGGALPGPVSSGEILNATNQNLVAGHEWPRRSRLSVVPGGHLPPTPPGQVTLRLPQRRARNSGLGAEGVDGRHGDGR